MRVLVSRLSSLGDVVCTLPVAGAIKSQWPDSEVVWIVDKRFRGIVECCASVDRIVERPAKPWETRELGPFDAALDMQGLLKSGVLVGFARAKTKLGYHWQREGSALFSSAVKPDSTSLHVVDQYVDVARALGAEVHRATFDLAPNEADLDAVRSKLLSKGVEPSKFVVCNAGAGWATKRWSPESFAKLSDAITGLGTPVAFLGAPTDRAALDEVRSFGASNAVDMIGETNVRELVALVSLASLHVGGDTGSTHIAAALGVPAIGVYTLTRPERSCPYGQIQNCFPGDASAAEVFDHAKSILEGVA